MKEWYIYSPQASWLYNQNTINKIINCYPINYFIFIIALYKSYERLFKHPLNTILPFLKERIPFVWQKPLSIKNGRANEYLSDKELEQAARLMIKEIVDRNYIPMFEEVMFDPISKEFKPIKL